MPTTTDTLEQQFRRLRARYAEQSRRGLPGDPETERTRAALFNVQQRRAQDAALRAVELRNGGAPAAKWIPELKPKGLPMGIVLLEATELLAYLVRASDRPDELLAALRAANPNHD